MSILEFNNKRPTLGQDVFVDDSARIIGDVLIGDHVSVWPGVVIRGDVFKIEIGNATNVQDGCVIHGTHRGEYSPQGFGVTVGKNVTIGHRAVIHGCTIGDNSLIGIGVIVMDGAVVEDNVMIGAGSLVPPGKKLERGGLYVGSPVRRARDLKQKELEMLRYSGDHYVRLKNQYLGVAD